MILDPDYRQPTPSDARVSARVQRSRSVHTATRTGGSAIVNAVRGFNLATTSSYGERMVYECDECLRAGPKRARCVPIVQELCESRGGRPGLSVLTSLLVSVGVKLY